MDDIKKDILEKLSQFEADRIALETELNNKIAQLRNSYEPRLQSLATRYESYKMVAEDLKLIGQTQQIDAPVTEQPTTNPPKSDHETNIKPVMRIGDAIEFALRERGSSMPLDDLMASLTNILGSQPKRDTVRSELSKDPKKRFESVEIGVYKLRDEVASRPQQFSGFSGFNLQDAFNKVVSEFNEVEDFSAHTIFDALVKKHPKDVTPKRKPSISAYVSMLYSEGKIFRVREGKGGQPAVYRKTASETNEGQNKNGSSALTGLPFGSPNNNGGNV